MNRIAQIGAALLLIVVFATACRRQFTPPSWEAQLLTPLLKTSLTIGDIVNDTLMQVESDSSITLVYTNSLYEASLDSLVTIEVNSFQTAITLDSLRLSSQTISHDISLGRLATESGAQGQAIIDMNGTTTIVPPLSGLSAGPVSVDASDLFESATLQEGWMDLSVFNGLPIAISNATFSIENQASSTVVASGTFPSIPAGSTQSMTIDLAGQTIESTLDVYITNMDIPGTFTPVLIDTSDAVTATMQVYDLRVLEATAIFPAQEVLHYEQTTPLANLDDIGIKFATIQSGTVDVEVVSTAQDTVYLTYEIPGAVKDGTSFYFETKVPPAAPGDTTHVYLQQDCSGYDFDFSGAPGQDTINAFFSILTGRIDSTGQLVYFSLLDSATVNLQVNELIPSYVRGYLGNHEFEFGPASTDMDVFAKVISGELDFADARIGLSVNNGLGLAGEVNINQLTAINTNTNASVDLDLSNLPQPLVIQKATDNPLTPVLNQYELNNANSNPSELLAVLPNRFVYDLSVETNPQGNNMLFDDFAYTDFDLEANIEIELPLNFMANSLVLADTAQFLAGSIEAPEQIESGTLHVLVDNGFPLSTDLRVVFLDEMGDAVLTLQSSEIVEAAALNASGKVDAPLFSKLDYSLDRTDVDKLLTANRVTYRVDFSTEPDGEHVKIYSDYSIDFQLTGDFIYRTAE